MATALDLARKAVSLNIPTYELTHPSRGAADRLLRDGDVADLVPVGPIDAGPLSSLQSLVQTQKSGLAMDIGVPSSAQRGFVLRDPNEEFVEPHEKGGEQWLLVCPTAVHAYSFPALVLNCVYAVSNSRDKS